MTKKNASGRKGNISSCNDTNEKSSIHLVIQDPKDTDKLSRDVHLKLIKETDDGFIHFIRDEERGTQKQARPSVYLTLML